jgi:GNAT superfamily N-acetyltransferase
MIPPGGVLRLADGGEETFWCRRLRLGEADAAYALHRQVAAGLPPDLVAAESREFFADHAERVGQLLGVFTASGLAACAVLGLPGPTDGNFGVDHGLPAELLPQVAHLDGASVHPRYRGNNLHRLLIEWRIAEARMAGRPIVLSTAAPRNRFSLDNLLACGLRIRGLIPKFGGLRYLLRRDLDREVRPGTGGRWVAAEDFALQDELLRGGQHGWQSRQGDRREIYFAVAANN